MFIRSSRSPLAAPVSFSPSNTWLLIITFSVIALLYITKALLPELVSIAVREAQNLSVVRNYFNEGLHTFWRPIYDVNTPGPAYLALEFPLMNATWAAMWQLFGQSLVSLKLLSVAALLGMMAYTGALMQSLGLSARAIAIALAVMAMHPLLQVYGPTIMVDTYVLFATTAAAYHVWRWLLADQLLSWHGLAAVMFAAFALITKIFPAAPMLGGIGLVALWWVMHHRTSLEGQKLFILCAVALLSLIGIYFWYQWGNYLNTMSTSYMGAESNDGVIARNFMGDWASRLRWESWQHWINTVGEVLPINRVTPRWVYVLIMMVTFPVALWGLVRTARTRNVPLLILCIGWAVVYVLLLLALFRAMTTHDYYNLPYVQMFAILFAIGADDILNRLPSMAVRARVFWVVTAISGVLCAYLFHGHVTKQFPSIEYLYPWARAATAAGGVGALLIWVWRSQRQRLPDAALFGLLAAIFVLMAADMTGRGQFDYWRHDNSRAWYTTASLLRQMDYVQSRLPDDKRIVVVSHRGFLYPEFMYRVGASGQMLGFPSTTPWYGYPPLEAPGKCMMADKLPVRLDPPCIDWLREHKFYDYFVAYVSPPDDMPIEELLQVARANGLELVDTFTDPLNSYARVYHLRDKSVIKPRLTLEPIPVTN
jgi:4-amino-4-deoxy-L-arabinose transferase-like glycosyltransferase